MCALTGEGEFIVGGTSRGLFPLEWRLTAMGRRDGIEEGHSRKTVSE